MVRGQSEIVVDIGHSDVIPASSQQGAGQFRPQWGSDNQETADAHKAPPQPAEGLVAAMACRSGRQQYLICPHRAVRRDDLMGLAAPDSLQALDRHVEVNLSSVAFSRLCQSGGKLPHMHLGALLLQKAALIAVAVNFCPDLAGIEDFNISVDLPQHALTAAAQGLVMGGLGRQLELAAAPESAVDLLLGHQALNGIDCGIELVVPGARQLGAVFFGRVQVID